MNPTPIVTAADMARLIGTTHTSGILRAVTGPTLVIECRGQLFAITPPPHWSGYDLLEPNITVEILAVHGGGVMPRLIDLYVTVKARAPGVVEGVWRSRNYLFRQTLTPPRPVYEVYLIGRRTATPLDRLHHTAVRRLGYTPLPDEDGVIAAAACMCIKPVPTTVAPLEKKPPRKGGYSYGEFQSL